MDAYYRQEGWRPEDARIHSVDRPRLPLHDRDHRRRIDLAVRLMAFLRKLLGIREPTAEEQRANRDRMQRRMRELI
jgi:hypothetical protein